MTGEDLRSYIRAIGITQRRFAAELGVNEHAVKNWIAGRHRVPGPVAAYVALAKRYRGLKLATKEGRG